MNTNRDITEHFFYSTGDSMKARSGVVTKFVMEISENIYNEQDKSKNCKNYPNENFASYFDCEEHFVQQTCQSFGVAPIWLFEDLKNVTRDPVHSPDSRLSCLYLYSGDKKPHHCPLPCRTFHVNTKFISSINGMAKHGTEDLASVKIV